jgi:hypothetical protein
MRAELKLSTAVAIAFVLIAPFVTAREKSNGVTEEQTTFCDDDAPDRLRIGA